MRKNIIVLVIMILMTSVCWAEQWMLCRVRSDGCVFPQSPHPTSDTTHLGDPPAGMTWKAIPFSEWHTKNDEGKDGVPVYVIVDGHIVDRDASAIAAERSVLEAKNAKREMVRKKHELEDVQSFLDENPNDTDFKQHASEIQKEIDGLRSKAKMPLHRHVRKMRKHKKVN